MGPLLAAWDASTWAITVTAVVGTASALTAWWRKRRSAQARLRRTRRPTRRGLIPVLRDFLWAGSQSIEIDEADAALEDAHHTILLRKEEIDALKDQVDRLQKEKDTEVARLTAEHEECEAAQEELRRQLAELTQSIEAITRRRDVFYSFLEAFAVVHSEMHIDPDVKERLKHLGPEPDDR